MVKMMMRTTVRQAAEKARLQELTLEAIYKRNRTLVRPLPPNNPTLGGDSQALVTGEAVKRLRANPNPLQSHTMEQRRLMGLCYKCGEKF